MVGHNQIAFDKKNRSLVFCGIAKACKGGQNVGISIDL